MLFLQQRFFASIIILADFERANQTSAAKIRGYRKVFPSMVSLPETYFTEINRSKELGKVLQLTFKMDMYEFIIDYVNDRNGIAHFRGMDVIINVENTPRMLLYSNRATPKLIKKLSKKRHRKGWQIKGGSWKRDVRHKMKDFIEDSRIYYRMGLMAFMKELENRHG